jgi:hypothetical protein
MSSETRIDALAKEIESILSKGISPGGQMIHYIDSTFLNPSAEDLEALLGDGESGEVQSLLELIFFPDETFQTHLEGLLSREDFREKDVEILIDYFRNTPPSTKLYLPEDRGILTLSLPKSCAPAFIRRLRISKKLSPALEKTVDRNVPRKFRDHVKVKLRNSRFEQTGVRVAFLDRFFEKMKSRTDDFSDVFEYLGVVFDLFHETRGDGDVFQGLVNKKNFLFRSLQAAAKNERQLAASNKETLLLLGKNRAYVDKADIKKKMDLIDKICRAVYGRIVYTEPVCGSVNLGHLSPDRDLEAFFGLFR